MAGSNSPYEQFSLSPAGLITPRRVTPTFLGRSPAGSKENNLSAQAFPSPPIGEGELRIENLCRRFSFVVIAAQKQVSETEVMRRSVIEQGNLPERKIPTDHPLRGVGTTVAGGARYQWRPMQSR